MTKRYELRPEHWVEEHGDYLMGYACKRLKDHSAAEDVLHETFLAALRGRDSFKGEVSPRYWLLGILKNKIIDEIRKSCREVNVENTDDLEIRGSLFFEIYGIPVRKPASWRFNPRKAAEQNEFWKVYLDCVSKLQGMVHKAYSLSELEGLPTAEVCKVLGIEPNYLWVLLHRARGQLKACLQKNWIDRNDPQ